MPHSAELRRQVEQLAVHLMVDDPNSGKGASDRGGWVSDLEKIQRSATAERAVDVAAAAVAMIEAIQVGGDVQQSMARMQQALDDADETSRAASKPPSEDPELLGDFVLESREYLATIESQMLAIERNPAD